MIPMIRGDAELYNHVFMVVLQKCHPSLTIVHVVKFILAQQY